jgi:hypothetical protein
MNHSARIAVYLFAAACLLLAPAAHAARKAKEILQYIPAETPYVFAMTEPYPEELQEKFEPLLDETLAAYRQVMRLKLDESRAEMASAEGGAENAARMEAFVEEFMKLMSVEGIRGAGIGKDSLFAFYGDGLLPVMRLGVTDTQQFEATIKKLEEKAEQQFQLGKVDGKAYRFQDIDKLRLVVATLDKDAVITFVPTTISDERLARTLGIRKPPNTMARAKTLRKISKEYGFTEHFVGFIDVERIAATFTGDPSGLNSEILETMGYDAASLPQNCGREIGELAAVAPRIVMGYTNLDEDSMETRMVIELRDDIATGLATLPALVPGLGTDLGGLFSFGMSLDLLALRTFFEARLDAMEADPFECALFADLQASTAQGRAALAQPVPPIVYSFRGFLARITDFEGMDLASSKPPETVDGGVLVAIENAEALLAMAAMFSPELAEMNLLPDGKAREVILPESADVPMDAFAALSTNALAVTVGTEAGDRAEDMLSANGSESRPFMSFAMDTKRYNELVGQMMMIDDDDELEEGEEPLSEEMRAALRDAVLSSGSLYERMLIDMHLTTRGIEVGSRISLAE